MTSGFFLFVLSRPYYQTKVVCVGIDGGDDTRGQADRAGNRVVEGFVGKGKIDRGADKKADQAIINAQSQTARAE